MGVLIDTQALVALERAGARAESLIARFDLIERVAIAAITVSELYFGVLRADSEQRREARLNFIDGVLSGLEVLPFDAAVAETHARIWANLSRDGTPIGSHDLLIAATAVHYELTVITANMREFSRVPGLLVLPPPT